MIDIAPTSGMVINEFWLQEAKNASRMFRHSSDRPLKSGIWSQISWGMSQVEDIPSDSNNPFRQADAEKMNFLAKYARFQVLKAENEELNRPKQNCRRWSVKRTLVPPTLKKAAKVKKQPSSGAPLKNRSARKHGRYSAETLAFWATITACVHSSYALVEEVDTLFPASKHPGGRPRAAPRQSV